MKYLASFKIEKTEEWVELALACRKKNINDLKRIEASIKEQFKNYDQIISNYDSEPETTKFECNKKLLIDYYESAPEALNKLIFSRRIEHGLLDCPFCGNPKAPDTLDHFIPKDDWPEFSINPNNLVPQCRECAPTKGSSYYCDENKSVLFLHPIYSSLLSQFKFKIIVNFSSDSKITTFDLTLIMPDSFSQDSTEKIILHLKKLKVKERIKMYSSREIKKWKNILSSQRFDIEEALTQRLNERAEDEKNKDWKTALYAGIIENRELIAYLNSLSPKRNVVQNQSVEVELEF